MDDADLIREFRNGNREAFSALALKYSRPLTLFILKIVRDEEEAKDLSQASFLKAYQGLPRFFMDSSFKTWLYSIALNTVKDHLRKKKLRLVTEITDQFEDPTDSPAEQLERAQYLKKMREAVDRLPEKQRLTLQLRIYDGMDYKEIAEALGGTAGAARGNFFQAAKTLREKLGSEP
jgi:RNA polymerase sigma-70 factor (ECF subfamily)